MVITKMHFLREEICWHTSNTRRPRSLWSRVFGIAFQSEKAPALLPRAVSRRFHSVACVHAHQVALGLWFIGFIEPKFYCFAFELAMAIAANDGRAGQKGLFVTVVTAEVRAPH